MTIENIEEFDDGLCAQNLQTDGFKNVDDVTFSGQIMWAYIR